MGDAFGEGRPEAGEWPVHQVTLPGLCLDATAVTNEQFAAAAAGTGHITGAEEFGASAVFHLAHRGPAREVAGRVDGAPWWLVAEGAGRRRTASTPPTGRTIRLSTSPGAMRWRTPRGPASDCPPRPSGRPPVSSGQRHPAGHAPRVFPVQRVLLPPPSGRCTLREHPGLHRRRHRIPMREKCWTPNRPPGQWDASCAGLGGTFSVFTSGMDPTELPHRAPPIHRRDTVKRAARVRTRLVVALTAGMMVTSACSSPSGDDAKPAAEHGRYPFGLVGEQSSGGDAVKGDTLTIADYSEPRSLDPSKTVFNGASGGSALAAVYDTLMWCEPERSEYVPWLAKSLTAGPVRLGVGSERVRLQEPRDGQAPRPAAGRDGRGGDPRRSSTPSRPAGTRTSPRSAWVPQPS